VSFATKSANTKADDKGAWKVELPAMKEGEKLELTVKGKNPPVTLKNIILGDIWVCSGQSNMEWALKQGCLNFEEDAKDADFPKIRRIKFNHVQKPEPQPDAPAATPWQICTPETSKSFTAVGFYFAREISQ
jgi:sialate O-acetylesterase